MNDLDRELSGGTFRDAAGHHEGLDEERTILLDPGDGSTASGGPERHLLLRLGLSFFLFGLINNVLYVVILSAALDLVPPSTPKGIIAFCNIFPALVVKLGWPYLLKGRIHYARRLVGCCVISISGMIVVASFDGLFMKLLGISFASFSSGHAVGYFASGTGAAGIVGALLWWEVRNLGVRTGVGISSVLPLVIPLAYFLLLPHTSAFVSLGLSDSYEDPAIGAPLTASYTPLPTDDAESEFGLRQDAEEDTAKGSAALSLGDKWVLVKPLLTKYMLPLFCVYLFEYTINQGISPTLVYPVPSPDEHWLISKIIHSIRDYYPLWQLVYQTTVFLSRSSISMGLPALPARLIALPAIVQFTILVILAAESAFDFFGEGNEGASFALVFLLISIEGICGGLAYVNVFFRVNQELGTAGADAERARQEREFKIGSIGLADSTGILLASLAAVPTEIVLCRTQVARGKQLCQSL